MSMDCDFWDRVKALLSEKKLTQVELADAAGVSVAVMRNWIYRDISPAVEQSVKIANYLGVSVEYLVNGTEPEMIKIPDDLQQMINKYSSL